MLVAFRETLGIQNLMKMKYQNGTSKISNPSKNINNTIQYGHTCYSNLISTNLNLTYIAEHTLSKFC